VFYDSSGNPLDFRHIEYSGLIPGGLGKRVYGVTDSSVAKIVKYEGGRVEIRVIDFEIIE
jgi:hypothetical protein